MPDEAQVHVIAVVDFDHRQGEIKFVLPVSGAAIAPLPADTGYRDARVKLALRDRNGALLWQASPPLGIITCDAGGDGPEREAGAMIQHTIAIPDTATALQLLLGDMVVDEFSTAPAAVSMGGADFSLSDDFAAAGAAAPADDRAVSYSIQARPVGDQIWQTLAAARSSPDYEIDPNQFGGATEVDVRVTRNRGFRSEEVSQRRTVLRH